LWWEKDLTQISWTHPCQGNAAMGWTRTMKNKACREASANNGKLTHDTISPDHAITQLSSYDASVQQGV
jgi:hypothetical protein